MERENYRNLIVFTKTNPQNIVLCNFPNSSFQTILHDLQFYHIPQRLDQDWIFLKKISKTPIQGF